MPKYTYEQLRSKRENLFIQIHQHPDDDGLKDELRDVLDELQEWLEAECSSALNRG